MFSKYFIAINKFIGFYLLFQLITINAKAQGGAYGQLLSMTDYRPNIPMPSMPSAVGTNSSSSTTTYQMTQADYDRAFSNFLNETGNKINDKGVKFFKKGDYEKALRNFEKALKYLPKNAVIQKNIENTKQQLAYKKAEKERMAYDEEMKKYNEKKQKQLEEYNRKIAEKEISDAIIEIAKTKQQIAIIQHHLRIYSKELSNNTSEFEKWSTTSEAALKNTIDNSKEYIAQLFIKYGLLNALNSDTKKEVYNKFSKYLHSTNPAVQKWFLKECTANNVDVKTMEKIVNAVNLDKDLIGFIVDDKPALQQNLNALLFINSFFEGAEWVNYKELLSKKFPGAPGDYFDQAKMIGETYSDLAAQCLSWYNIHKLTNRNDEIAEDVKSLSISMESQQKKLECLHDCLENEVKNKSSKYCIINCKGLSRLSSPVPPL